MNFGSFTFLLIFLPISIVLYFVVDKLTKKTLIKNILILAFSVVFYCWVGIKFFVFILALSLVNYGLSIAISKTKYRKASMITAIVVNVLFLIFFKYLQFLFGLVSIESEFVNSIIAPIGVSFIVFHLITFIVDIYRQDAEAELNPLNLLVYVFFFPKVIVGPITPYKDMIGAIKERSTSFDDFASGLKLFIFGLIQKVFIADLLSPVSNQVFSRPDQLATWLAWVGLITYTIQIFVDFVSYTNMAIGLAKIFGFKLPENFNYPYCSGSISEFWRRWHITLGAWFRNYVYIPLGGNRKGIFRTYFNLFVIFLLTGIWHGAAWQFILWGIFHGVFVLIERAFLGKYLKKAPRVLSALYTVILVMFGWVLFNSKDLSSAGQYFASLFNFNSSKASYGELLPMFNSLYFVALTFGLICCFPIVKLIPEKIRTNNILTSSLAIIGLVFCIIYLSGASFNPFIYFNF